MREQTPAEAQQVVFNRVWEHFITKRNHHGVLASGECAYRGVDGSRCALGLFIPDELYRAEFDDSALDPEELITLAAFEPVAVTAGTALLFALRREHDGTSTLRDLEAGLRRVAHRFGLTIP